MRNEEHREPPISNSAGSAPARSRRPSPSARRWRPSRATLINFSALLALFACIAVLQQVSQRWSSQTKASTAVPVTIAALPALMEPAPAPVVVKAALPTPEEPRVAVKRTAVKKRRARRARTVRQKRKTPWDADRAFRVEDLDNESTRQHYLVTNKAYTKGSIPKTPAAPTNPTPQQEFIPFERTR